MLPGSSKTLQCASCLLRCSRLLHDTQLPECAVLLWHTQVASSSITGRAPNACCVLSRNSCSRYMLEWGL